MAEEMIRRIGVGDVDTDERSVAKELGVGKDRGEQPTNIRRG